MGMAASQVRLLQLTARKNDIGYQLQNLSLQKTSLSRDMQRVTKEYQNALSTKTLKWSNNSGVTYVDLSYANLMRPGSVNGNVPYLITNASGNVVVDSQYQKYAEMISADGSAGGDYESVRTKILSSLCGISSEDIEEQQTTQQAVVDATNKVNGLIKERDILEAEEPMTNKTTYDFIDSFGNVSESATGKTKNVLDLYKSNENSFSLGSNASSAQTNLKSLMDSLYNNISNYLSDADKEAMYDACDTVYTDISGQIGTNTDDSGQTTVSKEDKKLGNAVISSTYKLNMTQLIDAILGAYASAGGTVGTNTNGSTVYAWRDTTSTEWQDWKASYDAKEAEITAANEELSKAVDEANQVFTSADESMIDFYDQRFTAIADRGWVGNSQVSDNDYLNQMLQNNQYYITTMEAVTDSEGNESYEYSESIASNFDNIYTVNDTDAQNEAQVEYEYEKSIINEKETRIDTRMQDLETEQSAINEMIKGIESVRDDNTDRTFSIFS